MLLPQTTTSSCPASSPIALSPAGLISRDELSGDEAQGRSPADLPALCAQELSLPTLRALAQIRHGARLGKDFKTADAIRDHLKKSGVVFEDTADGVRYRLP